MFFTKFAIFFAIFSGFIPFLFGNNNWGKALSKILSTTALGLSGVCATLAGGMVLFTHLPQSFQLPMGIPWFTWQFKIDVLSGFFFAVVGIITIAVSIYVPAYLREIEKPLENSWLTTSFPMQT